MRIEVATPRSQSAKAKGDLLEAFAVELMRIQNYSVEQEVRRTASELDLLCRNPVNSRQIYVECKAHRDPLSAGVLQKLVGIVFSQCYSEGWLISAGPLGKDAKGFQVEWEAKPQEQRQKLSIYNPDRVINALKDARLISDPPTDTIPPISDRVVSPGGWTLLITESGRFWVQTVLVSGAPEAALVFSAERGDRITDPVLLKRLADTDCTLSGLDFEYRSFDSHRSEDDRQQSVIQVQHGESWSDYRPSHPNNFVGRKPAQDGILKLLNDVRSGTTSTRIFAITGDSGMGKSSLIAKLRSRTQNIRYRKKVFLYAVDVRAATKPSYILASLLACLRETAGSQFVEFDTGRLEISDHADPLSSPSVHAILEIAAEQKRVICLVFDQFEELYSKPEMFPVFEEAQRLFLSVVAARSNLVLGFAWRTDSTVLQDHPAYYMWHRLADHRLNIPIGPFEHSEASAAITTFEKELGQKLLPGIRRQISENSRGYPWLLKKLCIHLYEKLGSGKSQARLVDTLDVETLFAGDLTSLNQPEINCLKVIAAQAPADWHEVLGTAGAETLRALQDKRLIVRSGNRINLYWDLFREYVLTDKAPSVPFTYVPSASLGTLLAVTENLNHGVGMSFDELSEAVGRRTSTVQNIVHDLKMFRIAQVTGSRVSLDSEISSPDENVILEKIRAILKRHALYLALSVSEESGRRLTLDALVASLRRINPTAHHGAGTWKTYAERIAQWLSAVGLFKVEQNGWILDDHGKPIASLVWRGRGKGDGVHRSAFQAEAPPEKVIACLDWIRKSSGKTTTAVKKAGHRNALAVLVRWGLVQPDGNRVDEIGEEGADTRSASLVWKKAWSDSTLVQVRKWLESDPSLDGLQLGERLAEVRGMGWARASKVRVGNGMRRWGCWLLEGEETSAPPSIPRKPRTKIDTSVDQGDLFGR